MNRDIEFRGMHSNKWLYGYLVKSVDDNKSYITVSTDQFYQVKEETIGQYTGLKDKNGKKIFEGDIINITYDDTLVKNAVIEYHGTGFYACTDSDMYELDNYFDIEVIGNIYENKELLGDSNER